jgi:hypothetical protein
MEFVQLPPIETDSNRPFPHPEADQLAASDHAVLSPRQPGHLPVKNSSVQLALYMRGNCTLTVHAADAEAARRTRVAHFVPTPSIQAQKRPQPAVAASSFDPFK